MIPFDLSQLRVEIVQLKTVSTALGGSISIVDPTRSVEKKDVLTRITVPMAVARAYIKMHKISRHLKPMVCAVIRYGNHIIALERHPLGGFGAASEVQPDGVERKWIPASETRIRRDLANTVAQGRDWFFDGRYMFAFPAGQSEVAALRAADHISMDGAFRKITVDTIDLQHLSTIQNFEHQSQAQRTCLAYVSHTGQYAISPPIWKNLSDVGMTGLKKEMKAQAEGNEANSEESELVEDKEDMRHNFDRIDERMGVNLNFVLAAGREIGQTFGYDMVEPLQLPRLMVELHTVNLPNVPKEIKSTYNSGLKFSEAMAWLLGMQRRANTLETHITMRSLMKYLTKRGLFRTSSFDASRVFQEGKSIDDVPVKKLEDIIASQDFTKTSFSSLLESARKIQKARKEGVPDQE